MHVNFLYIFWEFLQFFPKFSDTWGPLGGGRGALWGPPQRGNAHGYPWVIILIVYVSGISLWHKLDSPLSLYVHFCLHIHVFCPFHPEGSQNKTKFSVEFCPHGPQLTAAWTSTSSAMVESKSEHTHGLTAFYTWGMSYPVKEVNAIKIPIFNIFLHSRSKLPRIERNLLKVPVTATILPSWQWC